MSQFFGCITLTQHTDIAEIALKMQKNMAFFTPDAIGIYQTERVFICNKLLHNTPESLNTPLIFQNDRYVLAASCRIDNRETLNDKLNLGGAVFGEKALSDHDYILKAYEVYQEACVNHLIGDFSFVVWDKQAQKLYLAKDHLGVRSLFYTQQNDCFFFSTDLNAFLNIPAIILQWSKPYIASMLAAHALPIEPTCYEQVYRLKPACYALFQDNKIAQYNYWQLEAAPLLTYDTEQAYYDAFLKLFEQAITCRVRSLYNIGCDLSGGLDSSGITCMTAKILGEAFKHKLHTFSFVQSQEARDYDPTCREEEQEQEIIISHINLPRSQVHKVNHWGFDSVFEYLAFEKKVNGGIEATETAWQKPTYELMKKANCRTKLSGFLGDEMVTVWGHEWYFDVIKTFNFKKYVGFIKAHKRFEGIKKIIKYWVIQIYDFRYNQFKHRANQKNFLNPRHKKIPFPAVKSFGSPTSFTDLRITRTTERPYTTLRMEHEHLHGLRENVEVTFPFADIRLLEFMLQVPPELFKPVPQMRAFYRNATRNLLPDAVRLRNDKTMNILIFSFYRNYIFFENIKNIPFQKAEFLMPELINFEKIERILQKERGDLIEDSSLIAKLHLVFKLFQKEV
jgi:asparagine synthase (glutamine-hydrolysing)